MTERKRFRPYDPRVFIDADNAFSLVFENQDLPKRDKSKSHSADFVQMRQDTPAYSFIYEYGYQDKNRREKYIKQYIQSLEDPHLQVEQLIHRSSHLGKNNFVCSTKIVEGKKTRSFVESQYNGVNYLSGNIHLYPYIVENDQQQLIAQITNFQDAADQFSHIQDAINRGESMLRFIHPGQLGTYSVYVPLLLNDVVTRDLFKYFNNPKLPQIEDFVIMPEELDFYVELSSFN